MANLRVGTGITFDGATGNFNTLGIGTVRGAFNATGAINATSGLNVGTAATIHANGNVTCGIVTSSAFIPTSGQLSHRNLIINGAMMVAQRGTSSTSSGVQTIDRYSINYGGTDEAPTMAQVDVSSGTTPYTLGFKKAFKITNGNQSSGAGAADYMELYQYLEDQDISNSGWNFKSSSSYITISFWIKSSVAQKFTGFFYTNTAGAGDSFMYSYQIDNGSGGNLSADTWTKITHSIPGNSSLSFNNDNSRGFSVGIYQFNGTNYTTSDHTENAWSAWDSSDKIKDMTSTWYTTNDATLEITGLQLEVGSVATPFEHRSFADELRRCQRYYIFNGATMGNAGKSYSMTDMDMPVTVNYGFPVQMRATPSVTTTNVNIRDDSNSSISANINSLSIYGHQYGVKKVGGQSEEYGLTISDFKYDAEL